METPPGTTLSTPSPTELQDRDPVAAEAEKIDMLSTNAAKGLRPINLVVATTPCAIKSSNGTTKSTLGIGKDGSLPWPMIKADMNYFKEVTEKGTATDPQSTTSKSAVNSVIMGRKTYISIPQKFRPLARRKNIVITRSGVGQVVDQILDDLKEQKQQAQQWASKKYGEKWLDVLSNQQSDLTMLELKKLRLAQSDIGIETKPTGSLITIEKIPESAIAVVASPQASVDEANESGIFCIGGSEIYKSFLQDEQMRPRLRILQTEIERTDGSDGYECDTFWPEDLENQANNWHEAEKSEVVSWTGIELPQKELDWHYDEKVGVRLRVKGWKQKGA